MDGTLLITVKSIFKPYALFFLISLFLAFSNVFIPKYFLSEDGFKTFRSFFNLANIYGPLLILGVDVGVGVIKKLKLISFIKFSTILLTIIIPSVFLWGGLQGNQIIFSLVGALLVGSIQLTGSFFLKFGKLNLFYFVSQIYGKIIPLAVLLLTYIFYEGFHPIFTFAIACVLLAIPIISLAPYFFKNNKVSPNLSALKPSIVGLVFGTMAIDLALRLPYLMSFNGDIAVTNIIDICTAFTTTLLYPAMLYSRHIEVNSKMVPGAFYQEACSGYFSIFSVQLIITMVAIICVSFATWIGVLEYDTALLIQIGSGLAFCATIMSVIPNFLKIYICTGFNRKRLNYLWLAMIVALFSMWWVGYFINVVFLIMCFLIITTFIQYFIAKDWVKSSGIFVNYYSLSLSLVFLVVYSYESIYII